MQGRKLAGVLTAAIMLAISGLATTTAASAAVFELTNNACSGGATIALCYQGSNLAGVLGSWELEGEQSITAKSGTVNLSVPSLETLGIQCSESTSGTSEPVILQHTPLGVNLTTIEGGTLTVKGCHFTSNALDVENCTVPATNTTKILLGELESTTDVLLTPESGTTFIEFEVKNKETLKCGAALLGNLHIKGTQLVTILNAGTPELTKPALSATLSGLIYGELNEAELEGTITVSFTGLEDLVFLTSES